MMHPAPQTAVKVDGQAGALGAAAALLGFHPTDSLVVMCLSGPRRRIGPVIRVDLDHGQVPAGSVEQLAAHAARHADEVIVMTFTDTDTDTGADAAPATAALVAALHPVCTVLEVIDAANTAHEIPADLLAATALTGRAVLPDRAALARSVAHTTTTHPADPAILAAMDNVTGRDQWLITHGSDPASLPALVTAAQATGDSDPRIPNMCAALAVIAYRKGDGALAQVALDRALHSDPAHRLAQLMLAVMAAGMHPSDLDDLLHP